MRLTVSQQDTNKHTDACTAVDAAVAGDILSAGDDFCVWRWNASVEPVSKIVELESGITVVRWLPGSGRKKGGGASDTSRDAFVVACANGTFCFVSAQSGRIEKSVDAHTGAITSLCWGPEATTIVTSGEDGAVKVWSQSGVQRSTLVSTGKCIYALVWGPDSQDYGGECVVFASGAELTVKPLNPGVRKQLVWKAHRGTILCVDYSRMSNVIVSGGEDGTYRVWDAYGRNLFTSVVGLHPVTAVSVSPDGEMFAVGSFMSLRVCDRTGWTHCHETTNTGSAISCAWTADSTQIVVGGGSGSVSIAQLVDRKVHWQNLTCTLSESRRLRIHDVTNDSTEELEHRDVVIKMSVGYGFLVVATATQCVIYDVQRWNAPTSFDLRDSVVTIQQCAKCFFIADCSQGVQVYSYEGRLLCTIKPSATIRPEALASALVSLSLDTLAIRDPVDTKRILYFDAQSGRANKDVILAHHMDILECGLSQYGSMQDRKIAFVDRNRDLYIAYVHNKLPTHKLAAMVTSARWSDSGETLVAVADGHIVSWAYPSTIFIDRELLPRTKHIRDDAEEHDRNDVISYFFGSRLAVRRGSDGALLTYNLSPYPGLLFAHVAKADWDGAVRLCRYIKEDSLWAVLAALAVKHGELGTAEIAYAALEEVDKLRFISAVKEIPSAEGRQAQLALFQRRLQEAESILLQANLVLRAIDMHTTLYNWERALEIAVERRTHIDTVLMYRQKHLEQTGRKETLDKFRQVAGTIKFEVEKVQEKIAAERAKERERGGGGGSSSSSSAAAAAVPAASTPAPVAAAVPSGSPSGGVKPGPNRR